MDALSCCICGPDKKGSDSKGIEPMFFPIPYAVASSIAHLAREEKVVARKRRDAWLKLLRDNVKKYPGGKVSSHICSLHFHSGKPADLHDLGNVDWLPSLKLSGLESKEASNGNDPRDHSYSAFPSISSVDSCQESSNDSSHSQQPLKPSEVRCCVEICGRVKGPDTMLFRFPQVENYPLLNQPAVARRRDAWLKAVGRECNIISQQALYICSKHFPGKRPAPLICVNHVDWKPTLLLERETVTPIMTEFEEDPLNVAGVSLDNGIEMASPSELPDIIDEPVISSSPTCCDSASKLQMLTPELSETKALLNQKSLALEESLLELKALKKKLACNELRQKEQQNQAQKELVIGDLRNNDKATKFYTGLKSWSIFTTVFNAVYKPVNDFADSRCILTKQQELLLTLMRLRLNLTIGDLGYRFRVSESRASTFCFMWVNLIFYNLPASNITGPGPEMPKRKYSIEDKLRRNLKRTFSILSEEAITKDMYTEDKMGFSFLYKATYVCDYLMKMNNESTDSSSPTPNE